MLVAQSPAHNINSSKGCPFITESFPLCCLLVHKMWLSPLARHCQWCNPIMCYFMTQEIPYGVPRVYKKKQIAVSQKFNIKILKISTYYDETLMR
jgi:hypothetical protein